MSCHYSICAMGGEDINGEAMHHDIVQGLAVLKPNPSYDAVGLRPVHPLLPWDCLCLGPGTQGATPGVEVSAGKNGDPLGVWLVRTVTTYRVERNQGLVKHSRGECVTILTCRVSGECRGRPYRWPA